MAAAAQRRRSSSASPEFRFWPLDADPAASPSCADELFSGGVLLPLQPLPYPRRDADLSMRPPSPAAKHAAADRRPPHHKDKPTGGAKKLHTTSATGGGGIRGINLSVNSCIGYRHQVSCRRADAGVARASAGGGGGGGLFGIKGFFSKKVSTAYTLQPAGTNTSR
uniref:Uncharacterized protein n=1 Tax=Oryza barthii TaxID=65489 RepID=A0A0D3HM33_9ORYZ